MQIRSKDETVIILKKKYVEPDTKPVAEEAPVEKVPKKRRPAKRRQA